MPLMQTPQPQFGAKPHDFNLKGIDGKMHTLGSVKGKNGTIVMFICNHCPYVKAIVNRLVEDMKVLQQQSIGVVAIMSNDVIHHPADNFENMQVFAKDNGFSFPYVIDETQEIAKKYGAVCTPDFFGYNAAGELQFRGRLDEVNPSTPATSATKKELLDAMLLIAKTGKGPENQMPSMGCNIKWKQSSAA